MIKVYLAIPYSGMRESSFEQANKFTVYALKEGYNPFSPITHSHPLTEYDLPGTWDFWAKVDKDWIDCCDEVWVLIPKEGEERIMKSTGVLAEIGYGKKHGKEIRYFNWTKNEIKEVEQVNVR